MPNKLGALQRLIQETGLGKELKALQKATGLKDAKLAQHATNLLEAPAYPLDDEAQVYDALMGMADDMHPLARRYMKNRNISPMRWRDETSMYDDPAEYKKYTSLYNMLQRPRRVEFPGTADHAQDYMEDKLFELEQLLRQRYYGE